MNNGYFTEVTWQEFNYKMDKSLDKTEISLINKILYNKFLDISENCTEINGD